MTVQAYILVQTEVGTASGVTASIRTLDGVSVVEDVTGPYDVIVRAEAATMDDFGHGLPVRSGRKTGFARKPRHSPAMQNADRIYRIRAAGR